MNGSGTLHIEVPSEDELPNNGGISNNESESSNDELKKSNDKERNVHNEDIQVKVNTVKLQRRDLRDIFSTIDAMNTNTSNGYAKAQLEMAKIVWLLNIDIDKKINFKQLQRQYVISIGKLNDICSKKIGDNYEVKLPKISIPEFSGKQDEWQPFIELFKKIVHNQESLSDSIKMQYFKTSLKDEAAKLIKHIAPSGENYRTCFELLHKRYENKRQILGNLLDQILNLLKQKNENANQLKLMHDTTIECIMAIKHLKLLHKLSSDTIRDYECQLADVREPQSLEAFLKFIDTRHMALMSAENKSSVFQSSSDYRTTSSTMKCLYCQRAHYTSKCTAFLKLDIDERMAWVKKEYLCFNCLCKHKLSECKNQHT